MTKRQKVYGVFKRLIALIGSFVGIFVLIAFVWWWSLLLNLIATKGHPVFVSKRIGKGGKEFGVLKFRSMKNEIDSNLTSEEIKKIDNPYTWFGKFLRKTNIDETLQLLNIFIGQMSFIGPRPLIDVDGDHITNTLRVENGAINLRPGISGYAQVNGRTDVTPEEKAKMDGYYYKNFGFCLDFKIFFITIFRAFGLIKKPKNN